MFPLPYFFLLQGMMIILVIHQPRFNALKRCHDLVLVGKGGQVAYNGPTDSALQVTTEFSLSHSI